MQIRPDQVVNGDYKSFFISPHFDDVPMSIGGYIARLAAEKKNPLVITVCTARPGDAPSRFAQFQHEVWGGEPDPYAQREAEDRKAMEKLGCDYLWLDLPDAIYRGELYLSDDDLFGPLKLEDKPTDELLYQRLGDLIRPVFEASKTAGIESEAQADLGLFSPLGVGNHVDHQLVREVTLRLAAQLQAPLFLYEDLPYSLDHEALSRSIQEEALPYSNTLLDITDYFDRKLGAIREYRSQIDWVFRHWGDAETTIRNFARITSSEGQFCERIWRAVI